MKVNAEVELAKTVRMNPIIIPCQAQAWACNLVPSGVAPMETC